MATTTPNANVIWERFSHHVLRIQHQKKRWWRRVMIFLLLFFLPSQCLKINPKLSFYNFASKIKNLENKHHFRRGYIYKWGIFGELQRLCQVFFSWLLWFCNSSSITTKELKKWNCNRGKTSVKVTSNLLQDWWSGRREDNIMKNTYFLH